MYTTIKDIKEMGFVGFITVNELRKNINKLPNTKGVYMVIHPEIDEVSFLETGTGGYFKGKNPNVELSVLKQNWINKSSVIYIGQCGGNGSSNTLKKRIKQYIDFGSGKNVGHYGGRYIWQIKNNSDLLIAWKELPNENPSQIENELLVDFNNHFGKLPFANLRY